MIGLQGKQAFVTGATGFIGSRLAKRLATIERVHVRALVRNPEKGRWLADIGVELVSGDITDPASLYRAVEGSQLIFHAAAWVSERGTRDEVWSINVGGTQNLVDAARAAGNVERFVHLSSCAVYGSLQRHNINEQTPTRICGNIYADSKVAAEAAVLEAYHSHRLPAVLIRASQVYGPGSKQFTVRPIKVIKSGKMILIDGGRHLCKPIYIENLIDGLVLSAKVNAAIGEAINLTDGQPIPWRDFFGAYGRMLNIESFPSVPFVMGWMVAYFNEKNAARLGKTTGFDRGVIKALRSSNSFSNQKAQSLLGWQPKVSLDEGMQLTKDWLRAEGYLSET